MTRDECPASIRASYTDAKLLLEWLDDWIDQRAFKDRVRAHVKKVRGGGTFFCGQSSPAWEHDTLILYQFGTVDRALIVLHELSKAGFVDMDGDGGETTKYRRARTSVAFGDDVVPVKPEWFA